jgi:hypothetical protein
LLNVELRTISRHLGPIVASLASIKAQLQKIYSRPLRGHFDRVKMFHLRRAKEVSDTLTERLPPLLCFHQNTSDETKFEIQISQSETHLETNKSQIAKIENIEPERTRLGVLHI